MRPKPNITLTSYSLVTMERMLVEQALLTTSSLQEAAELLGIGRTGITSRIDRHGLRHLRPRDRRRAAEKAGGGE